MHNVANANTGLVGNSLEQSKTLYALSMQEFINLERTGKLHTIAPAYFDEKDEWIGHLDWETD